MSKRVSFITLGCAKNEVDTAHMTARLVQAGYEVLDWEDLSPEAIDGGEARLDAIIVNTCSFLREAIEESLDTIFDAAGLPSVADGRTKLVVTGCLPSRFGDDLESELSEAQAFIPCKDETAIVATLDQLFGIVRDSRTEDTTGSIARTSRLTTAPSAYVKISDGCDRFCSFCAIPFIRGRYHSFTYESIHEEVQQLVEQGVVEVVLIAQDTGIWGSDLEPKRTLASLLDSLASSFPGTWFRVLYIQPEHVSEELLATIASHENICNYLDIPFQHVDRSLLKSMNRQGSREEFLQLIDRIRTILPEVALRTTYIVGYPGETEEQFDALCDFVSETDFDYVGVFAFSPEDGTRAAELPDRVDEDTKQERLRTLRELADTVSSSQLKRFIGQTLDVLVLGWEEDGQLLGRSGFQAPDVDGVTYLDKGTPGQVLPVLIEDTLYYEMEGTCEG
ncbi:30S ribosomal protein S12 methylthiotransferase RimO [Anaerotardibacter muris]|uniref:30S ribosomal protein S12 methylthiotransferase RimO n=1 Tax=Anaerotardibacter muris TaxID=2941505 RepID=UPI002042417A|nr:30S ribosomal protein S12 methylthiotransferase RimO [Anaerotardibacter muris]